MDEDRMKRYEHRKQHAETRADKMKKRDLRDKLGSGSGSGGVNPHPDPNPRMD